MPLPSNLEQIQRRRKEKRQRFDLSQGDEGETISNNKQAKNKKPKRSMKAAIFTNILHSDFVLKIVHSRASQFISGLVGFGVGKIMSTGVIDTVNSMPAVAEFLTESGLMPTEASLTVWLTALAWAGYNMAMTLVYGSKFKEIQHAHGLEEDRWAGPKTMEAAKRG
jgi:hypothetical protein